MLCSTQEVYNRDDCLTTVQVTPVCDQNVIPAGDNVTGIPPLYSVTVVTVTQAGSLHPVTAIVKLRVSSCRPVIAA